MKNCILIPTLALAVACASGSKTTNVPKSETKVQTKVETDVQTEEIPQIIPQPFVNYRDSSGAVLEVFHFVGEPEKIQVTSDGVVQLLTQVPSETGVRYNNPEGYEFWDYQGEGTYLFNKKVTFKGTMN